MSLTVEKPARIGNRITDVEILSLSPSEAAIFMNPKLDCGLFASAQDYRRRLSGWMVPSIEADGLSQSDFDALYYAVIEVNPFLEYERLEWWRERGYDPLFSPAGRAIRDKNRPDSPAVSPQHNPVGYRQQKANQKFVKSDTLAQRIRKINLTELEAAINTDVIGQQQAVSSIFDWLYLIAGGVMDDDHSIFSGYLMGPSGVGKTTFVENLAARMELPFKQFSGSEYQDPYDAKRFLGSAPGLVGYEEEGGPLQQFASAHPNGIVLFDEADKMHPSIWNSLTNFLDKGHLLDGKGRELVFNGLVFFTSNIGFNSVDQAVDVGFARQKADGKAEFERLMKLVHRRMPYEIIGRLNEFFLFEQLEADAVEEILAKNVKDKNRALRHGNLEIADCAREKIIELGTDRETGVRQLKKIYEKQVLLPFIREHAARSGKIESSSRSFRVEYHDGSFAFIY